MRQIVNHSVVQANSTATVFERSSVLLSKRAFKYIVDYSSVNNNMSFECMIRVITNDVEHSEYSVLGDANVELSPTVVGDKLLFNVINNTNENITVYVTPISDPSLSVELY